MFKVLSIIVSVVFCACCWQYASKTSRLVPIQARYTDGTVHEAETERIVFESDLAEVRFTYPKYYVLFNYSFQISEQSRFWSMGAERLTGQHRSGLWDTYVLAKTHRDALVGTELTVYYDRYNPQLSSPNKYGVHIMWLCGLIFSAVLDICFTFISLMD